MKILLTRKGELGKTDDWTAEGIGLRYPGIGRTSAEAIDSLVRANLTAFNVTEFTVNNPWSGHPVTTWTAQAAERMIQA